MPEHTHGCTQAYTHAGMHIRVNTRVCVCGTELLPRWEPTGPLPCRHGGLLLQPSPGEGCGLNLCFAQALVAMSSGGRRISEVPLLFLLLNFLMF